MPQENFDRLGSTIVALGNNLATTESEIVEMSLRFAGAGKQVGMTEAEIMGLAAALSSVSIEVEAGGHDQQGYGQYGSGGNVRKSIYRIDRKAHRSRRHGD